jgi:hypothetical protein
MFNLLPPDIAAFFNSTQMELTQQSPVHTPARFEDPEVISLTSSELDDINERPSLKRTTLARSPDVVPETQVVNGFVVDCLVRPHLFIFCMLLTQPPDDPDVVGGA